MRRWLLVVGIVAGIGGCARVRPYERETLAHPRMQAASWPEIEQSHGHVRDVREGTGGATGSPGGGCGCN